MNKSISKAIRTCLFALMVVSSVSFTEKNNTIPKKLIIGKWKSERIEFLHKNGYVLRECTITENQWTLKYEFYLDEKKQLPVFETLYSGSYTIGPSKNSDGRNDIYFKFNKIYLKLLAERKDIIKGFGLDKCKLTQGEFFDVTNVGCSFIDPISVCAGSFDIIKVEKSKLFLGKPTNGDGKLCESSKRPVQFGHPLVRF